VKKPTLQTPRSGRKEEGGGARGAGAESLPLQLMLKTVVRQVVPVHAVHGGPWWSKYPRVDHGRDPRPEQVDAWRKL